MMGRFRRFWGKDVAIDLGTANTLVYVADRGIVFNEPTVIAVKREQGRYRLVAMGREAKAMIGRTPAGISAVRPLSDGAIADFDLAQQMIRFIGQKALGPLGVRNARVILTVPSGATGVERRAIREATELAGARRVHMIEEPLAAAIGAGLAVTEPTASMVVDIGGGTTEVAVLSLGGIVASQCIRVGGRAMDEAILSYIRRAYKIEIGEIMAEQVKLAVGSAVMPAGENERRVRARGRDIVSGVPCEQEVGEAEIARSLGEPLAAIIEAVQTTLERTAPELAADMVDQGIVITGGGSLLPNLDLVLRRTTGLPIRVAAEPQLCGALGAGRALEQISILDRLLVH